MRCVTASIIFFIIAIIAVSKYADAASKGAGVMLKLDARFGLHHRALCVSAWSNNSSPQFIASDCFNILLLTDIWVHCHHCVRSRLLPHF